MQKTRGLASGFLLGVVSILIILGGAALALAESNFVPVINPPTQPPLNTAIVLPTVTLAPSQTALVVVNDTSTPTATETATLPPAPTNCPLPNGWIAITVKLNDTLYSLAARYNITPETLIQQNCLLSAELPVGSIIYVPPVPTTVPTACRPPSSWIVYIVQPGDNLYRLSLKYRTSVTQLQRGNCMGSSQAIYAGQRLYVPNVPTSTPDVTNTPLPSATQPTATDSPTSVPPSNTPVPPSATPASSETTAPPASAP